MIKWIKEFIKECKDLSNDLSKAYNHYIKKKEKEDVPKSQKEIGTSENKPCDEKLDNCSLYVDKN